MRILSLFVALFCTTAAFAQQPVAPQAAAPAPAAQPAAAPAAAQPAIVTVNKPVIPETAPTAPAVAAPPAASPAAPAAPRIENTMAWQMLNMNNSLRAQVGLAPHRLDPQLTMAAQDHANYMASTGDFQHYSNGGPGGRAAKYGYPGGAGLENIAMGQPTVESAFGTWRASGGHWASIVSGTSDAGFGYAMGRNGMAYWVGAYGNGGMVSYPVAPVAQAPAAATAPVATTVAAATPAAAGSVVQGTPYPTGTYPVGTQIRDGKIYYPVGTVFNTQGQPLIR